MFSVTIAEAFAAETDPNAIAEMLAEFGLEVIKQFGPEYLAQREQLQATCPNGTRRN